MTEMRERIVCFVGHPGPVDDLVREVALSCGVEQCVLRSVDDCRKLIDEGDCNLLLIDLDGDAAQGLVLIAELEQTLSRLPTIALVDHGDIPTAVQAIRAGATTCLERPVDAQKLRSEIGPLLAQSVSNRPASAETLTPTEETVLRHILAGKTSREIAKTLHRSPRTVETHRSHIMHKLGASSTVDLVRIASAMGFVVVGGSAEIKRSAMDRIGSERCTL